MSPPTSFTAPDTGDFTRNDWIGAGRIFSGIAAAVSVIWLAVALIGMRAMPSDDILLWFDSVVVSATDRYRQPRRSRTVTHSVTFAVVKPDGFKRYLTFDRCSFGSVMAADIVGKRTTVAMWDEAFVSLAIEGRSCLRVNGYRARHERARTDLSATRPLLAIFAVLFGLAFAALMRLKLDAPSEGKT